MKILVISACSNASGEPDFALTEVECTKAEYDEGTHYEKAEDILLDEDYEGPFVHFDANDLKRMPKIREAIEQYLSPH